MIEEWQDEWVDMAGTPVDLRWLMGGNVLWCGRRGCPSRVAAGGELDDELRQELLDAGWRHIRAGLWLCPACAREGQR